MIEIIHKHETEIVFEHIEYMKKETKELYRFDGPAQIIFYTDIHKIGFEYFINGMYYTEEEYYKFISK